MAFGTGILIKHFIHRGGTQDTDFNKGIIGRIFTKFLRRRNGGGQGHSGPLIEKVPPLKKSRKT